MSFIALGMMLLCSAFSSFPAQAASTAADLHFRLTADPATLDWNLARSSHETYIIMNIMEGLVEEGSDLKPHPALAERWEVAPDGKTYTFYLRSGVKWSDGKPLKASDFVDSWIRLLRPGTKSSYANFLFDIDGAEAFHSGKTKNPASVGVKAIGDSKLEVRLRQSVPYFLHIPTFWVTFPIRADLIRKYGKRWATPGKMATLGPYLLTGWKKGKSIELERNPNYFGKLPDGAASHPEALIETDDGGARKLFEKGRIDFLLDATTADLVKFQGAGAKKGTRVEQFPYLATYYLGFNVAKGPLANASVRKAIALAIDRAQIPSAMQAGQQPADGWIPPGVLGHGSGSQLSGTLYDARGALTAAGFEEGRGFPKLVLWVEPFDGAQGIGEFISKSLHDHLGIAAEVRIDSELAYQRALKGGEEGLFVGHWGADFPDPANFFEVFHSGSGTNSTGWSSREYDKYVDDANVMLDPKARLAAYAAAEKILLQRDVAILPLFYKRNTVILGSRVSDFSLSPLNYLFLKEVQLKGQPSS